MTFETPQFVNFDQFTIYALRRGWIFQLQDFPPVDVEIVEITKVIWLRSTGITPPRLTFVSSETGGERGSAKRSWNNGACTINRGRVCVIRADRNERAASERNHRKPAKHRKRAEKPEYSKTCNFAGPINLAPTFCARHNWTAHTRHNSIDRRRWGNRRRKHDTRVERCNGCLAPGPSPVFHQKLRDEKKKKIGTTLVQLCLLRVKK